MKHLAANVATVKIRQPFAHAKGRPIDWFGRCWTSRYSTCLIRNSWCSSANFLEMRGARFHYSVICGYASLASVHGFIACHLLSDKCPASTSGPATAAAKARAADNTALKPDAGRLRFRIDERKKNANDRVAVVRIPVDFSVTNTGMISMRENIHATYPLSAAVAPILHTLTLATLARRGTTLSTGAAE